MSTDAVKNGHIPFALYFGSGVLELHGTLMAFSPCKNVRGRLPGQVVWWTGSVLSVPAFAGVSDLTGDPE